MVAVSKYGKRVAFTQRIAPAVAAKITAIADERGVSRNDLVNQAIMVFLREEAIKRLQDSVLFKE